MKAKKPRCGERERPPMDRVGVTHKVTLYLSAGALGTGQALDGQKSQAVDFYITLNRYADGRPCEVFVKATNGYQGWCDAICRLTSLALQHGVPADSIIRQLENSQFPPSGRVPGFGFVGSFPDYLAKWLKKEGMGKKAEGGVRRTEGSRQ